MDFKRAEKSGEPERYNAEIDRLAQSAREIVQGFPSNFLDRPASSMQNGTPPMDELTRHRLDEADKRSDRHEAKLDAITTALNGIQVELARKPGRGDTWGAAATIAAVVLAVGALLFNSAANQLSAFQSGLAAVQTAVALKPTQETPAAPANR